MKRKYQKALRKINIISLIKISLTIILFIVSISIKKIPILLSIIFVFLYIFFLVEFFVSRRNLKEIYEYLAGHKKYKYKPVTVPTTEFMKMIKEGIPANTYISYNKSIHTIETKKNKYFFLDFQEYKSYNDIINAQLANIKIKNIEEITFLSYNGEAPSKYIKWIS